MNEIMNIIGVLILLLVGVLMSKKGPSFAPSKDENVGSHITWFKLDKGEKLFVTIESLLFGHAEDFVAVMGYHLPDRHIAENKLGALVTFVSEIPNGDFPYRQAYITQQTLVNGLLDFIHGIGDDLTQAKWMKEVGYDDASQITGKGTKASPEVVHDFDSFAPKDGFTLSIHHVNGSGTRSSYKIDGGQTKLE